MANFERIKEIRAASDGDFGKFIVGLKLNGFKSYEYFLVTGFTEYLTVDNEVVSSKSNGLGINIDPVPNAIEIERVLAAHLQGKTNFPEFIKLLAKYGVYSYESDLEEMQMIYYDINGGVITTTEIKIEG